ncbi:MAG: ATP-binding protein [Phaeospirillum sp.]|nr:ATP-binding protein [Phaeospirillum sp.]
MFEFLWSSDFLPHGLCLSWRRDLVALMLVSELVIAGCYISVAASLAVFAQRRPDFPYPGIMTLFAVVFSLCGVSHVFEAAALWLPWYGVQALFNAAVALLAIPAAWKMWALIPQALALPSPHHLQQANAELAREVTGRRKTEASLREAMEVAESASRTRSAFLATMSHELRTPLNAVIGFADALRHQFFGGLNDKQRDYVDSIHDSGQHLLCLINDVLDISKIDAGKLELSDDRVDLAEIVGSCITVVGGHAREAGVALTVACSPAVPNIRGDALRLKQIVLNLLSNAIKFTPRGGRVMVGLDLEAKGGVTLEVRDTGIGMRPEDVPKAFEMFIQIDNPMVRRFGGTGIGLPLTRSLVELHGGRVELESTPDRGTRVTVHLPADRLLQGLDVPPTRH